MAIEKYLKQSTLKKIVLALVISTFFIGPIVYLISKKLDESGMCWTKGRALSDEELYQNAMRDFVQNLFDENDAYRVRRGTLGFKRRAADFYYCDKRDCDVWIAPPATYKDIHELKSKFRTDSAYIPLAPDAGSSYNEMHKIFGWQRISTISEVGIFKQTHNSKTILTTIGSEGTIFYPSDCCEIYTVADWNELLKKYPSAYTSRGRLSHLDARKYLIIKRIDAPEISISYNGRSGRSLSLTKPMANLYTINACGRIQNQKNTLELYPNIKE